MNVSVEDVGESCRLGGLLKFVDLCLGLGGPEGERCGEGDGDDTQECQADGGNLAGRCQLGTRVRSEL